jgi:hypothetical protein
MCASLVSVALATTALALPAQAQGPVTAQVPISAIGEDGVSGLALLSAAANGGTNVQIVVASAPADTFAVIHGGDCDAIDPAPVALLGDVSATSQVAVANAFETIADGGHVLALHAGLDLATAIGCGVIPEVVGVTPDPAPTTGAQAEGGSFTGPLTGMSIAWPATWERYEVVAVEGEDRIGLRNSPSSMLLAARIAPDEDPQACVREARQDLFDGLDAGALRDLAPHTDADGAAISGVEADRAWLAYRYVMVTQTGDADVVDYLECRRAGDVLLYILHRSPPAFYDGATEAREALLLDGLTLPSGPPAPTTPPAPTQAPATPDAACAGYEAWHDATLGRIDDLARLKSDVDEATNEAALSFDLTEYKLVLKRAVRDLARMTADQEAEAAPPAAEEAQAVAVEMFGAYEEAAQVLSDYYETSTNRATLERADRAKQAADKVEDELTDALVAVEAVCD